MDIMNNIDKQLEEFKKFCENTEIEYDYPLYQHHIYDNIKEFISKALEEQEKRLRLSNDKIQEATIDLVDKHFPKGECKERGSAIVLYAEMLIAIIALQDNEKHE